MEFALHDPAVCLAPNLFRSLKRGQREQEKLHVVYEREGNRIEFKGPEPLGADDLRVLQALVALAGFKGKPLKLNDTESEEATQLARNLKPIDEATGESALVVRDTLNRIASEAGYNSPEGGSAASRIRASIERLWAVSIIVQHGSRRMGFRLVSQYASDDASGQLYVALNPRITAAVLGGQHTRIDLREVRALKSDAARLLHQRLSAVIDQGKSRCISLRKLASYVWHKEAEGAAVRQRKVRLRKALDEIAATDGWTIEPDVKPDQVVISRKAYQQAMPELEALAA
jgi:hypothetical protein